MSKTPAPDQDLRRLRLRMAGMFSNVNEVIEQLRRAEVGGYRFVIDWQVSCYRDPDRAGDPWAYYFEPLFGDLVPPEDITALPELPRGIEVACTRDNIVTPRLADGECAPLLLPHNRLGAHALIDRHLALRPEVAAQIDSFQADSFRPRMIGLHVRGAGRADGGVVDLRRQLGETGNEVPVEVFCRQVDEALRLLPDAGIFACSDSSAVIAAIEARYGARVVTWPALRSAFGEMHAGHPENDGMRFDPYQLGLDVVCEAWLLSRTDLFVHGNSNVANFVLCKAPHLIHAYVQA